MPPAEPGRPGDGTVPQHGRLLIDAANVMGSRPDGWWRDRVGALQRLIAEMQPLAAARPGPVIVVVEGSAGAALAAGRHGDVEVEHAARGGRDAGDDRILELLAMTRPARMAPEHPDAVVTADRTLIGRAEAQGATVVRPSALLRALHLPDRPYEPPCR